MNILGPSLTGLRGTQVTGSISYTLVTGPSHGRASPDVEEFEAEEEEEEEDGENSDENEESDEE
jgi:hypothetical protein